MRTTSRVAFVTLALTLASVSVAHAQDCPVGEVPCQDGCMPRFADCCGDGTFCESGYECCGDGCMPTGSDCCGGEGYCPPGWECIGGGQCEESYAGSGGGGGYDPDPDYSYDDGGCAVAGTAPWRGAGESAVVALAVLAAAMLFRRRHATR